MRDDLVRLLSTDLPAVVRWGGAIARQLRRHDIALGGKQSGFAATDALTLADLSVQELLVAALRDMGPTVRRCRLEAEEKSGDLAAFARESDWVLAIDPIDGTRQYRDRTGGYAVMLHARTADTIHYSLVYFPEDGAQGTWLEARDGRIVLGPDDWSREARAALDALPALRMDRQPTTRRVLVGGFLDRDAERARAVAAAGLETVVEPAESPYPLIARGELAGALIHTPNVYDFPVIVHLTRLLGGDAVWVLDGGPIDFRTIWLDDRADMLRLPGIVACAVDPTVRATLVEVARDWSTTRYGGVTRRSAT